METDINKLREAPHWSYSAFNTFLACSLKYYFQYIEHAELERVGSCFPFGRAFHAALSERARKGGMFNASDAKDYFADFFKAEIDAIENPVYKPKENYDSLLQTGFDMLDAALSEWNDDYAVKNVAEGFSVTVSGLSKPLIGEFDLIVSEGGDDCIVDWKTSATRWPVGKADRDLQATAFSYAYHERYGKLPLFRFDVISKTKTPNFESHYTTRNENDFQRFNVLAKSIESAVQKGVFLPNETSFSCADCAYKNRCRTWHVGKR